MADRRADPRGRHAPGVHVGVSRRGRQPGVNLTEERMTRWILALTIALGMVAVTPLAHAEHFDDRGWTLLGETTVDSRRDTDVIDVGRKEGRFTKITLVVLDD